MIVFIMLIIITIGKKINLVNPILYLYLNNASNRACNNNIFSIVFTFDLIMAYIIIRFVYYILVQVQYQSWCNCNVAPTLVRSFSAYQKQMDILIPWMRERRQLFMFKDNFQLATNRFILSNQSFFVPSSLWPAFITPAVQ